MPRKMILALSGLLGLFALAANAQTALAPNSWSIGTPMPTPREGPFTGAIGQKIYVVGGENNSTVFGVNEVYDTSTDTWTTAAPMPTPRWIGASAVVDNVLYTMGGGGGGPDGPEVNVVEAYDPATDTWSTKAPMPIVNDSVYAAVENGIIYVIGGFNNNGGRLNVVESYNPATNTWSTVAPLKVAKSQSAVGVVGSMVISAGGLATGSIVITDTEGYNVATDSWTTLAPMPVARNSGCFEALGSTLYVAGGNPVGNRGPQLTTMDAYDPATNTWASLASMPNGVVGPGSASVGGRLYCFGGSDNGNPSVGHVFNYVQVYQPALQLPSIGAVISPSSFGGFSSASPGAFIEIYGSNLAPDTEHWDSDFTGVNAPISLGGTSVSIGGQAAFVAYISPLQVNALIPSDVGTGLQQVTVRTSVGTSAPYSMTINALEPGFLAPSAFNLNGIQYAVAFFGDGTYVLPPGAISNLNSRSAKPGDVIVLYGIGFGPVTPDIPAGQLPEQDTKLTSSLQMFLGGIPAKVQYAGLANGLTGIYQFNITVPTVAATGAVPLAFTLNGVPGTQTLYLAVGDGTVPASLSLPSNWSNTSNPNGPWSYNEGGSALPLVPDWNGARSTWASTCNQPGWAPSNTGGNFLPVWLQVNSCAAAYFPKDPNDSSSGNVVAGDVVVHTNDNANGKTSLGPANVIFTLPPSAPNGVYTISGALWDARLNKAGIRPEDWTLLLNGTEIASGQLSGTVSRSQAKTFSSTQALHTGDQVDLQIVKASFYGDFVGAQLTITASQ